MLKTEFKTMPKGCFSCFYYPVCGRNKILKEENKSDKRPVDCPLVQFPSREEAHEMLCEWRNHFNVNPRSADSVLDSFGYKKRRDVLDEG